MFCSISGAIPEEPAVSKPSGRLYERRLIEKHVQETGKDPVSGEDLSLDDIVTVKSSKTVKPRTAPATSVPGLLSLLQNEWDAVMLETHQLRVALHETRQELAQLLYHSDGANRVIVKLLREKEEAQEALRAAAAAGPPPALANGKRAGPEEEEPPAKRAKAGLPQEVAAEMTAMSGTLSKGRKKRAVRESVATPDLLGSFTLQSSHPLHKTNKPGITAIDLSRGDEALVATAGLDSAVVVYDQGAERIVATLAGHAKRATAVRFFGEAGANHLVSASADATVKVWTARQAEGELLTYACQHTLQDFSGEVRGLTVHPLGGFAVAASMDASWGFYDLGLGECLVQVPAPEGSGGGYTCCEFHPDGLILGTGTSDSLARIWETRQQKNVAQFEGHRGPLTALSFSENGYYLASAAADGVKLWDLRKLKNIKSLDFGAEGGCGAVAFDFSGLYLAVGAQVPSVVGAKQGWDTLAAFPDLPKKGVTALRWGQDARCLYVGSADHNLRKFGAEAGPTPMEEAKEA